MTKQSLTYFTVKAVLNCHHIYVLDSHFSKLLFRALMNKFYIDKFFCFQVLGSVIPFAEQQENFDEPVDDHYQLIMEATTDSTNFSNFDCGTEGLKYVAGYLAHAFRIKYPTLGCKTSLFRELKVRETFHLNT